MHLYLCKNAYLKHYQKWEVISLHPLADGDFELLSYDEGIETIDWDLMNKRDYQDNTCKLVCMAEFLAPKTVPSTDIFSIFVRNGEMEKWRNGEMEKWRNSGMLCNVTVHREGIDNEFKVLI